MILNFFKGKRVTSCFFIVEQCATEEYQQQIKTRAMRRPSRLRKTQAQTKLKINNLTTNGKAVFDKAINETSPSDLSLFSLSRCQRTRRGRLQRANKKEKAPQKQIFLK